MANYNSILTQYGDVKSPIDVDFMGKVLMAKQGQFDEGLSSINQTFAELKQQENLLKRDEDKARFAGKIQSILSTVNASGKLDLSSKNITGKIKAQVGEALDDYTVTQIANSQAINNFYTQAAEKQKKGDATFNNRNFNDALKLAKVDEYLKGVDSKGNRVDSIGSLQYNDYVDVANTQDKKAADYAKERGLKDQFLGRSSDAYETTDKYGVKVTREEIQRYLETTLDPKTSMQLQIDARASLGAMDDADFNTYMQEQTKESTNSLKVDLAAVKAYVASHSKEEGDKYKEQILNAESIISKNEAKIIKGTYDRNEMYSTYSSQVLKNIASNHDVDIITKLDKDHLPFDIMKDERDYALKLRAQNFTESKAARDAFSASTAGLGTETEKPVETPDQNETNLTLVQRSTYQADDGLSTYLKKTNMGGYNTMTPQQQWTFKLNLKPTSPLVKGSTAQLKNLTDAFQDAQGNYAKLINHSTAKVVEVTESTYNDLIGGKDLNKENLAQTMPVTAGLLKTKIPFKNLSKEQQLALTAEFAANNLQYNSELTPSIREAYKKVVAKSKSTLKEMGTTQSNYLVNALKDSTDTEEVGGFWSTNFNLLKGLASNTIGRAGTAIMRDVSYPFRSLIQGESVADESYRQSEQAGKEMENYATWAKRQQRKGMQDFWGGEDTNVTELESRDLRTRNGKPLTDIQQRAIDANKNIEDTIDKMAESYKENIKSQKAFTFSTSNKEQAKVVTALKAAILNSGVENVVIPANTNDITVDRKGAGYTITYTAGEGDKAVRIPVYVDKLPKNVENIYDLSVQNWSNSPANPNIKLETRVISPLTDPTDRDKKMDNLLENIGLSVEQEKMLKESPENTAFATLAEQRDKVMSLYPKEFYEKNKQKIEEILTAQYQAEPFIRGGQFYNKITYSETTNGKEEAKTKRDLNPMGEIKDDFAFELRYYEAIKNLKAERIAALNRL